MALDRAPLEALKNISSEVDLIPETTPDLPENRTGTSSGRPTACTSPITTLPHSPLDPRDAFPESGYHGSPVGLGRVIGLIGS